MKILLVCQYYYPEHFSVTNIAEKLVQLGHEVSVITGKPNYGFGKVLDEYKKTKFETINGVNVYRVNVKARKNSKISIILNYLSFFFNAKKFVKKFKEEFDIVLSISLSPVISISPALLYGKKHNVPVVLYCEDIWPESVVSAGAVRKNSLAYKVLFKWSKSIYSKLDRIIISSPSFKNYFEEILDVHNKGFDLVYQPEIESKKPESPVIYKNCYNVVYAGNIGHLQNLDIFIDAMKYIKTKDVVLHLIGTGQNLEYVKEKIEKESLQNIVKYEGYFPIEKTEAYLINADALIVTLKNEGYVGKTIPNKAIQYLKYGKPIVADISYDGKEFLSRTKGTIFVKPNSVDVAKKIDLILEMNEKEKHLLGASNKQFYDNNCKINDLVKEIETVLKLFNR